MVDFVAISVPSVRHCATDGAWQRATGPPGEYCAGNEIMGNAEVVTIALGMDVPVLR